MGAKHLGELSYACCFAGAVHADYEDDLGSAVHFLDWSCIGRIEDGQQFFFQQALEFLHVLDLLAVGFLAKLPQNLLGGCGPQIGADQDGLKIIERVAVDFLAEGDHFLDALREVLAGARDRLLHAVQEIGFLFFFQAAEQSLNHGKAKGSL